MGQWLKVALIVFGVCAGWMVIGYLIFDADDDDVVQTTMAAKRPRDPKGTPPGSKYAVPAASFFPALGPVFPVPSG